MPPTIPPISAGIAGALLPPPDPAAALDVAAGVPVVLATPPMPPDPAPVLAAPVPVADPVWSVPKDEAIVAIVVGDAEVILEDSEAVRALEPVTEELSKEDFDARDADKAESNAASSELDAVSIELAALDVIEGFIDVDDMVELVFEDLTTVGTPVD